MVPAARGAVAQGTFFQTALGNGCMAGHYSQEACFRCSLANNLAGTQTKSVSLLTNLVFVS
jgi:hypothetical protein